MSPARRTVLLAAGASLLGAGCSGLASTRLADEPSGERTTTPTATPEREPLPAATPSEAWTGHRHDAANTGHTPLEGPADPILRWRLNRQVRPTPVGDTVLAGGSGSVHALDAAAGRARWSTDLTRDADVHAPAVANGRVVALATDGTLAALDASDGAVSWSVEHAGSTYSAPVVAGDLVLVAVGRTVRAYALEDGRERWRYGPVEGRHAVVGGLGVRRRDCYVTVLGQEPTLRRLTTGGEERWRRAVAPPSAPPVVDPDNVYVTAGGDTPPVGLYALDRATGERAWKRDIGGRSPPAVADGRVFRNRADGATVALDAVTGEQAWRVPGAGLHGRTVAIDAARVYGTGETTREVRALSRADGAPVWRVDVGFDAERIAVTDGAVYVAGGGWLARLTDR